MVREILENVGIGVRLAESEEFARIEERPARIEAAVVQRPEGTAPPRPTRKDPRSSVRQKGSALHGRAKRSAQSANAKAVLGSRRKVAGQR